MYPPRHHAYTVDPDLMPLCLKQHSGWMIQWISKYEYLQAGLQFQYSEMISAGEGIEATYTV